MEGRKRRLHDCDIWLEDVCGSDGKVHPPRPRGVPRLWGDSSKSWTFCEGKSGSVRKQKLLSTEARLSPSYTDKTKPVKRSEPEIICKAKIRGSKISFLKKMSTETNAEDKSVSEAKNLKKCGMKKVGLGLSTVNKNNTNNNSSVLLEHKRSNLFVQSPKPSKNIQNEMIDLNSNNTNNNCDSQESAVNSKKIVANPASEVKVEAAFSNPWDAVCVTGTFQPPELSCIAFEQYFQKLQCQVQNPSVENQMNEASDKIGNIDYQMKRLSLMNSPEVNDHMQSVVANFNNIKLI